jgi:hypothetical protein
LNEKCGLEGLEKCVVVFTLERLKFIVKTKWKKHTFYKIGIKAKDKESEFEIKEKIMQNGLAKLKNERNYLKQELMQIKEKLDVTSDENAKKLIKINFVQKSNSIKQLDGKILFMKNKIDQSKGIQNDVEMMEVIKETKIDTTVLERISETLQEGVEMEKEVNQTQNTISKLLEQDEDSKNEIENMYVLLEQKGEVENQKTIVEETSLENEEEKDLHNKNLKEELLFDKVKESNAKAEENEHSTKDKNGDDNGKIIGINDVIEYHNKMETGDGIVSNKKQVILNTLENIQRENKEIETKELINNQTKIKNSEKKLKEPKIFKNKKLIFESKLIPKPKNLQNKTTLENKGGLINLSEEINMLDYKKPTKNSPKSIKNYYPITKAKKTITIEEITKPNQQEIVNLTKQCEEPNLTTAETKDSPSNKKDNQTKINKFDTWGVNSISNAKRDLFKD